MEQKITGGDLKIDIRDFEAICDRIQTVSGKRIFKRFKLFPSREQDHH